MCDTAYEIELVCLVIFLDSFEFEACLFLLDEFFESHLCLVSRLRIFQRIDHLERFAEEGLIRGIDLFPDHHHLDDICIPVIEDVLLTSWCERRENRCYIVAVFFRQWTSIEECLETGVRHDSGNSERVERGQKN